MLQMSNILEKLKISLFLKSTDKIRFIDSYNFFLLFALIIFKNFFANSIFDFNNSEFSGI